MAISRPMIGIHYALNWRVTRNANTTRVHYLIIIAYIHVSGKRKLFDIAQTACLACFLTGSGENGEQNGCQYRNDRDDNKQFDQRKSLA